MPSLKPILLGLLLSTVVLDVVLLCRSSSLPEALCYSIALGITLSPIVLLISFMTGRRKSPPEVCQAPEAEARTLEWNAPVSFANDLWLANHEFNKTLKATRPGTNC